ncbi:SNF2 domain-containing protein / helicase domain-containing protein / zinc finger protein [Trifolium repens]|nr:SNF2 domain-containing protein / helicase domain-containing protein / zinc finger protein [Trifolium repens]
MDDDSQSQTETYLAGFIMANIVGLRYYTGTINGREILGLVRDPLNHYDSNAIKVLNTQSLQVGFIERSVAAVLSPLIDAHIIQIEGIVQTNTRSKFRIPCQIHIFSHISSFEAVHDAFHGSTVHFISHSDPSFTLSHSVAVQETRADLASAVTTTTGNNRSKIKTLDQIFKLVRENLDAKNLISEPLSPPSNIVKSELLQHQKEALGWLFHRENSDDLPPFWEEKEGSFVNVLTNYQTGTRPESLRGGIFADGMGLGKTLTLLSLIAFDKMKCGKKRSRSRVEMNSTLIVCPPSVISTWITQLEEHTNRGALKTYMYYGDRRTQDAEELRKYDIVLTTYATLGAELRCPDTPVKTLEWRRIVLDEAHMIKNVNAGQSQAVIGLNGKRRWAVTGTPIQNGSYDLFSLMAFLHFEPFSIKSYWQNLVQRPLTQGKQTGLSRLQVLMAAISLRRTKDTALVGLPPKIVETCYVELSCEERKLYDDVKEEIKSLMMHYNSNDRLVYSYSTILSMILRLRQICTDMSMCPLDFKSCLFSSTDIEDVSKNPELLQTLVRMLQDGEDFDCPICLSPPTDIVITCCAHIFCRECILKTLQRSNSSCPLCRRSLSESDLFSAPPESSKTDELATPEVGSSTKVSTLIKLLTESRDKNPATKSVVFSQFRKMLLLLEEPLKSAGFKTLRLDGTQNAKQRAQVIEKFQLSKIDEPMILLASLKSSSTGINLTAASRVYLMEPWWNPAVEEQAMDRVHRIGQKEEVKIIRLIAKNSIEEKILKLQERKKEITSQGSGRRSKDIAGMGIDDLHFVLGE